MKNYIEQILLTNNDHANVIERLLRLMNKHEAHSAVLNFKLNNKLNKAKTILADQVLEGLNRLIDIHPTHTIK